MAGLSGAKLGVVVSLWPKHRTEKGLHKPAGKEPCAGLARCSQHPGKSQEGILREAGLLDPELYPFSTFISNPRQLEEN